MVVSLRHHHLTLVFFRTLAAFIFPIIAVFQGLGRLKTTIFSHGLQFAKKRYTAYLLQVSRILTGCQCRECTGIIAGNMSDDSVRYYFHFIEE